MALPHTCIRKYTESGLTKGKGKDINDKALGSWMNKKKQIAI